jgi:two-component system cell cycle sensor histidine kinase/response regulator CckA
MSRSLPFETKTILLVEDESLVLKFVRAVLEKNGFRVIAASSPQQAIRTEAGFTGPIHLLLTSLTMPGTSGAELAKRLQERRPELLVMLMSSYPDGQMLAASNGWRFIAKPFKAADLLQEITAVPATMSVR